MSPKSVLSVQTVTQYVIALQLLVLSGTRGAVIRCDPHNRDPCTKFPSLCTDGGGLCVIKGPCEYECVCPPDGRRGRDCSRRSGSASNPSQEKDQTVNQRDSHVESLLVFPKNLFWDLNHAAEPLEMMRRTTAHPLLEGFRRPAPADNNMGALEVATNRTTNPDAIRPRDSGTTSAFLPQTTEKSPNLSFSSIPAAFRQSTTPPTSKLADSLSMQSLNDFDTSNNGVTTAEVITDNTLSNGVSTVGTQTSSVSEGKLQTSISKSNTNTDASGTGLVNDQMPAIAADAFNGQSSTVKTSVLLDSSETATKSGSQTSLEISVKATTTAFPNRSPSSLSQTGVAKADDTKLTPATGDLRASGQLSPGHESFPTFFSGNLQDGQTANDEKRNAALAFVVQRVYHTPDEFPVFRRPR